MPGMPSVAAPGHARPYPVAPGAHGRPHRRTYAGCGTMALSERSSVPSAASIGMRVKSLIGIRVFSVSLQMKSMSKPPDGVRKACGRRAGPLCP